MEFKMERKRYVPEVADDGPEFTTVPVSLDSERIWSLALVLMNNKKFDHINDAVSVAAKQLAEALLTKKIPAGSKVRIGDLKDLWMKRESFSVDVLVDFKN